MPTFLTTPKMAPALAARIEASVRGRRGRDAAFAPRVVSLFRVGIIAVVALVLGTIVTLRRRDRDELEAARAALLDAVHVHAGAITADDRDVVLRAESALVRFAGSYDGDLVADELRPAGALATALARPAMYVRGPLASFTGAAAIAETASASSKDPLVACLLDPPPARAEKSLLPRVRAAYAHASTLEERTAHVHRFHPAEVALPFFDPAWAERVERAKEASTIARLRRDLEKAPLEEAKRAIKARLLLVAMDEPSDSGGPAELDGERAHTVRVGLVDLTSGKVLLRVRKRVDPSWISVGARSEYASGLDACALALDVRAGVTAP